MDESEMKMPWFKFCPEKWKAGKISLFGATAQGLFLNLCIEAWENGGQIDINNGHRKLLAKRLEIAEEDIKKYCREFEECGIIADGKIKFMEEQKKIAEQISKDRAIAGKIGMKTRWKNHNKITSDNI
jgi:hypothetical protein